jgi:hypothetical protein
MHFCFLQPSEGIDVDCFVLFFKGRSSSSSSRKLSPLWNNVHLRSYTAVFLQLLIEGCWYKLWYAHAADYHEVIKKNEVAIRKNMHWYERPIWYNAMQKTQWYMWCAANVAKWCVCVPMCVSVLVYSPIQNNSTRIPRTLETVAAFQVPIFGLNNYLTSIRDKVHPSQYWLPPIHRIEVYVSNYSYSLTSPPLTSWPRPRCPGFMEWISTYSNILATWHNQLGYTIAQKA